MACDVGDGVPDIPQFSATLTVSGRGGYYPPAFYRHINYICISAAGWVTPPYGIWDKGSGSSVRSTASLHPCEACISAARVHTLCAERTEGYGPLLKKPTLKTNTEGFHSGHGTPCPYDVKQITPQRPKKSLWGLCFYCQKLHFALKIPLSSKERETVYFSVLPSV